MSVLLLELNEVNFEQVLRYAEAGKLQTLAGLVRRHGLSTTTSEQRYDELEPWIQWVTAHTGLLLESHGVYRLGDIKDRSLDQIWEVLERQGVTVGAISPMNASNRCSEPAFFMPDPWTNTPITGDALASLYHPVAAAVNGNADAKMTPSMLAQLAVGLVRYARPGSYTGYASDVVGAARRRPWRKAMLLDRLLTDVFVKEVRAARPGFASLFLNAGAHIQHHYLFNSSVYDGIQQNPDWYVRADADPVLEVYELYDRSVAAVMAAFPSYRIMIATGLHQDPHDSLTLYWRLREHADFLQRNGVPFARVEPRMSRDFVVFCHNADEAEAACRRLTALRGPGGLPLFEVHNRGDSLFVELIWSQDIRPDFVYYLDSKPITGLRDDVAFVAVKNGQHNGIGYFIDTGLTPKSVSQFSLAQLPERIADACGVEWTPAAAAPLKSATALYA